MAYVFHIISAALGIYGAFWQRERGHPWPPAAGQSASHDRERVLHPGLYGSAGCRRRRYPPHRQHPYAHCWIYRYDVDAWKSIRAEWFPHGSGLTFSCLGVYSGQYFIKQFSPIHRWFTFPLLLISVERTCWFTFRFNIPSYPSNEKMPEKIGLQTISEATESLSITWVNCVASVMRDFTCLMPKPVKKLERLFIVPKVLSFFMRCHIALSHAVRAKAWEEFLFRYTPRPKNNCNLFAACGRKTLQDF